MILQELVSSGFIKAAGIVSAFLTNILLARILAPSELGQFYIIFSLAMFLSIIARFGLRQAALRASGEVFHRFGHSALLGLSQKIIKVILCGNFLVACAVCAAVLGGNYNFANLDHYVFYLLLWTFSLSLIVPLADILRGSGRVKTGVFLDAPIFNAGFLFALISVFLINKNISLSQTLSLANIVSLSVLLVALAIMFRISNVSEITQKDDLPSTQRILAMSLPMMFINMTTYLMANTGLWVVGQVASLSDAGTYGIALKLFNLLALPLLIINMSMEPRIVKLRSKGRTEELTHILRASATLGFAVSLAIVLGLLIGGRALITILFGADHASAYGLVMILAIANLINMVTGASVSYMLVTGGERTVLLVNVAVLAISVPLLIYLTMKFGAVGAAYGTAFMLVVQQVTIWMLLRQAGVSTHASGSIRMSYLILTNRENSST